MQSERVHRNSQRKSVETSFSVCGLHSKRAGEIVFVKKETKKKLEKGNRRKVVERQRVGIAANE